MAGLFQSLTQSLGLSPHIAWRVAFAIVPWVLCSGSGVSEITLSLNQCAYLAFYSRFDIHFWARSPFGKMGWWISRKDHRHDVTSSFNVNEKDLPSKKDKELENVCVDIHEGQEGVVTRVETPSRHPLPFWHLGILTSPLTWLTPLGLGIYDYVRARARHWQQSGKCSFFIIQPETCRFHSK